MSTEDGIRAILERHPFLRGLDTSVIDGLEDLASIERFAAGDALLIEGRAADRFFLLLDGTVALGVARRGERLKVIEVVREGDLLGWSWLIPPFHWTFEAQARTPVRALVIDAAILRERMRADHVLAHALMDRLLPVMAARLRAARMEVLACEENQG
ncbi:cyclic nucleotide-binding domain-containing protein [Pararhodospirillum oryzae]|nr:cyclic nucleotide-binding domain-containing protein [Pararhodospirillum oryzae]